MESFKKKKKRSTHVYIFSHAIGPGRPEQSGSPYTDTSAGSPSPCEQAYSRSCRRRRNPNSLRPNTRHGDGGGCADGQRSLPAAPMGRRSHFSTRSCTATLARLARWRRNEFQASSRPFSLAPPGPRCSVGASHLGSPKCECQQTLH
jgi:hypothetical protein